ncbi:MAG: hypothetical protein IKS49_08600 [Actinomycetaceae bacterium]|nr:hypothetical protein [Actinomycetaceae bacterium]
MSSRRLNCFVDEMGNADMSAGLYLVTLVFHDHNRMLDSPIADYKERISAGGLPDIPFHMVDLLHGKEGYASFEPVIRKPLLYAFATFVRTLPISYVTFSFDAKQVKNQVELEAAIHREVSSFLFDRLDIFQQYNEVVVYYDGGSPVVGRSVRAAFDFSLARNVTNYRLLVYSERRLMQAADYLNSIELAAIRYERGEQSKTYERFLGDAGKFKRNLLKSARRLRWS